MIPWHVLGCTNIRSHTAGGVAVLGTSSPFLSWVVCKHKLVYSMIYEWSGGGEAASVWKQRAVKVQKEIFSPCTDCCCTSVMCKPANTHGLCNISASTCVGLIVLPGKITATMWKHQLTRNLMLITRHLPQRFSTRWTVRHSLPSVVLKWFHTFYHPSDPSWHIKNIRIVATQGGKDVVEVWWLYLRWIWMLIT